MTAQTVLSPVRGQVNALLLRGYDMAVDGMCQELQSHREWLWTFLETEGVEPASNATERSLRQAVIWQELNFGTQSESGSCFVETLPSVIETCLQHSKNVLSYVPRAVQAHFAGQPANSLLTEG
ncbi:MAG: hypothetical protein ACK5Q5_07905 [Planctomycetaceae bacterium]